MPELIVEMFTIVKIWRQLKCSCENPMVYVDNNFFKHLAIKKKRERWKVGWNWRVSCLDEWMGWGGTNIKCSHSYLELERNCKGINTIDNRFWKSDCRIESAKSLREISGCGMETFWGYSNTIYQKYWYQLYCKDTFGMGNSYLNKEMLKMVLFHHRHRWNSLFYKIPWHFIAPEVITKLN